MTFETSPSGLRADSAGKTGKSSSLLQAASRRALIPQFERCDQNDANARRSSRWNGKRFDFDLVAAGAFGAIEGLVRLLHELRQFRRLLSRESGNADARRY